MDRPLPLTGLRPIKVSADVATYWPADDRGFGYQVRIVQQATLKKPKKKSFGY